MLLILKDIVHQTTSNWALCHWKALHLAQRFCFMLILICLQRDRQVRWSGLCVDPFISYHG